MNKNYQAGRRLEYEVMDLYRKDGYKVMRTAGSHGEFDVIAYEDEVEPIFIQCKRVSTMAQAKALEKRFLEKEPARYYDLVIAIKIKGASGILCSTVGGD